MGAPCAPWRITLRQIRHPPENRTKPALQIRLRDPRHANVIGGYAYCVRFPGSCPLAGSGARRTVPRLRLTIAAAVQQARTEFILSRRDDLGCRPVAGWCPNRMGTPSLIPHWHRRSECCISRLSQKRAQSNDGPSDTMRHIATENGNL
jgi:hypothetical protein